MKWTIIAILPVCVAIVDAAAVAQDVLPFEARPILRAEDLGSAPRIHVGPAGRVLVANPAARVMYSIHPVDGRIDTVSVAGLVETPFPYQIGWMGDRIWAIDFAATEVIVFSDSFGIVDRWAFRRPPQDGIIRPGSLLGIAANGDLFFRTGAPLQSEAAASRTGIIDPDGLLATPGMPTGASASPASHLPVWRANRQGTVVDTLLVLDTRDRYGHVVFRMNTAGAGVSIGQRMFTHPFPDDDLIAFDPTASHIVVVRRTVTDEPGASSFRTLRISPTGDTAAVASHEYAPVSLPRAWVGEAVNELAEGDDQVEAILRDGLRMPGSLPAVTAVLAGPTGHAWIRRELLRGADTVRWELLEPGGSRVGVLDLPVGFSIRAIDRCTAWAISDDDGALWWIDAASNSGRDACVGEDQQ